LATMTPLKGAGMDVASSPGTRTDPVLLQVADLERSRRFFVDVFGLDVADDTAGDPLTLRPGAGGHLQRSVVLTTIHSPRATRGLRLELEAAGELLDIFMVAKMAGYCTARLTLRDGTLAATIFDPDGHPVQLNATDAAAIEQPAHHPGDDARWSVH